jgi:hypothetical protein
MDNAWEFLAAHQTRDKLKLRPIYLYCLEWQGRRVWEFWFDQARKRLLQPYKDALEGRNS